MELVLLLKNVQMTVLIMDNALQVFANVRLVGMEMIVVQIALTIAMEEVLVSMVNVNAKIYILVLIVLNKLIFVQEFSAMVIDNAINN